MVETCTCLNLFVLRSAATTSVMDMGDPCGEHAFSDEEVYDSDDTFDDDFDDDGNNVYDHDIPPTKLPNPRGSNQYPSCRTLQLTF